MQPPALDDEPEGPIGAREVVAMCERLGFALAGVCDAAPSARAEFFRRWLGEGRHGEMAWLARNIEARLDPSALLPGARSVISVADQYAIRERMGGIDTSETPARSPSPAAENVGILSHGERGLRDRQEGRVARYARGDDYHEVMKGRLHALCDALRERFPSEEFRACVDTAPVMEREMAARAGLGWIGKHTLLIHPRMGSWLFLGEVVTTLRVEGASRADPVPDHCGSCTRCIDACPTQAITPYSVDARRCISYLTIEHRSPIEDGALRAGVGEWLFGCDVCQEVCPHNSARDNADDLGARHEAYSPRFESLDARGVAAWTEVDRRRTLAGSAMKRANLEMLRRNAQIVIENASRGTAPPPPAPVAESGDTLFQRER